MSWDQSPQCWILPGRSRAGLDGMSHTAGGCRDTAGAWSKDKPSLGPGSLDRAPRPC